MFHFSTDRLAGLDAMILKIATPTNVPTLIPNHPPDHDPYRIPARKLRKHNPHTERRTPLADRTASSNLPPRPLSPTSSMLLYSLSVVGEAHFLPTKDDPSSHASDIPSFRALPPLPSASSFQLPSFLDFSTQSLSSLADPSPHRPSASLPVSLLYQTPSPLVAPSRPVSVHETKNNKGFVGPHWIPAFHHPNSPYVPWSSPVRRRILPLPPPLPPSPDCSSLFIRTGAVAPEPWTSSTFSQVQPRSRKERLSNSWRSFKSIINKGVKTVVSRLGKARALVGTMCAGKDMLSNYDDTDAATIQPNNAIQSFPATTHSSCPRDSLASFVSSDSATLAAWLAEQHDPPSCATDSTPREMSVAEYELIGSWLNVRHCGGGWACGVRDCDLHSADGSPYSTDEHPRGLRMAMPFDSADSHSEAHPSSKTPTAPFPAGPFSASPRFHSLPRLPHQSPEQEAKPMAQDRAGRCLTEAVSMPGG